MSDGLMTEGLHEVERCEATIAFPPGPAVRCVRELRHGDRHKAVQRQEDAPASTVAGHWAIVWDQEEA